MNECLSLVDSHSKVACSRCVFEVGVLGINFKTADLGTREALARAARVISGEKGLFFPYPAVVLSTCNRTEIYFSASDLAQAHSHLLSFLRLQIGRSFEHRLYSYFGIDCFSHLCRVTAGLDSALISETQIQQQVKAAYLRTQASVCLPSSIHYLFQKSLHVAKTLRERMRHKTKAPSLFQFLFQIALDEWGSLEGKKILLVGYSEVHRGLASYLASKGVFDVVFCTRHPEVNGYKVRGRDELAYWNRYDIVSCASLAADSYLIQGHGRGRHLIFDLSVPRNVDPQMGCEKGILLFNIEQINELIYARQKDFAATLEEMQEQLKAHVIRLAVGLKNRRGREIGGKE